MRWRHRSSGKQPLTAHESLVRACATICASLRSRPEFNGRVSEPVSYSPVLRCLGPPIPEFFSVWGAAQLLITNEPSSLLSSVSSTAPALIYAVYLWKYLFA